MANSRQVTIAAVVITRNRVDLLRRTLGSLFDSETPFDEYVVCDDGDDDAAELMLKREFPKVRHVRGARAGISANRNLGIRVSHSDLILITDDDILVDTKLAGTVLRLTQAQPDALFFPLRKENGVTFPPYGIDFLGFATRPYSAGEPYHTANQQCFVLSRSVTSKVLYDALITRYGYEELDFAYRVAAAGFKILLLEDCVCEHLAPGANHAFQLGKDANRLYFGLKRYFDVDRNWLRGVTFLAVASTHHVLASTKRVGLRKGVSDASHEILMAFALLRRHRRDRQQTEPSLGEHPRSSSAA